MLSKESCQDIRRACMAAFGDRAYPYLLGEERQCFRLRRDDRQLCTVYLDDTRLPPGRVIEFFLSDKQSLGALSPDKVAAWMKDEAVRTGRGAKSHQARTDQAFPGLFFTNVEQFREFISRVGALAKGLPDPGGAGAATDATDDGVDSDSELKKLKLLSRGTTEQLGTAVLRKGQERLRRYLLRRYGKCMVTGVRTHDLLVCSHIVAWAANPRLRLDHDNVLLLSAGMDRLFDKGLIAFDDEGRMLIRDQLDADERKRLHLVEGMCLSVALSEKSRQFLRLHRIRHHFEIATRASRRR